MMFSPKIVTQTAQGKLRPSGVKSKTLNVPAGGEVTLRRD